ncbi:MAG: DsrE family protein [Promethearchaeota archaeon]
MKNEKLLLYVQTSEAPERQYPPLVLAQTVKAMDLDPKVYFLGMGLKILQTGIGEKIQLGDFPSIRDMLDKTMKMEIDIFTCSHHLKDLNHISLKSRSLQDKLVKSSLKNKEQDHF